MRERTPLPPKIQNAPTLGLGLELYYQAFLDLVTSRPVGMAQGFIPMSEILCYASAFGFDEDQTEELIFFVRELDTEYLKLTKPKS